MKNPSIENIKAYQRAPMFRENWMKYQDTRVYGAVGYLSDIKDNIDIRNLRAERYINWRKILAELKKEWNAVINHIATNEIGNMYAKRSNNDQRDNQGCFNC